MDMQYKALEAILKQYPQMAEINPELVLKLRLAQVQEKVIEADKESNIITKELRDLNHSDADFQNKLETIIQDHNNNKAKFFRLREEFEMLQERIKKYD